MIFLGRTWAKIASLCAVRSTTKRSLQFLDIGFHGDRYLLALAGALAGRCKVFIETGANVGSTLVYVAKNFPEIRCLSCEPDSTAFAEAIRNAGTCRNVSLFNFSSQLFIDHIAKHEKGVFSEECLFWLDAHGYGFEWPLKAELEFITSNFRSGYILIDDFMVPGREEFGYDRYGDQVCSFDYVKHALNPSKAYQLYYPAYSDRTSSHHPLRGWGLLVFGHDNFSVPEQLVDKVEMRL